MLQSADEQQLAGPAPTRPHAPAMGAERRASADGVTGWTGGHNPWLIAIVVTIATFMELLDTSIANVALPQISGNLGVNRSEGTWVLTSYLVANAIAVPIAGWASIRFGRKRFYISCVAGFTLASLLCGLAPSLEALIVCRVLQGLAGGGLVPVEQAILVDTFPPHRRGMAMAMYGMTAVLAPALGPTLGGIISDHVSWRWIFLINVPIGVVSLISISRVLTDPPSVDAARDRAARIDGWGLALIAIGLGCLEFVLEHGQEKDWFASSSIVAYSLVATSSLVVFVFRELRHETPIVDLRLLKDRNFAIANALMLVLAFTSYGVTVLMPQYLWALLGYTITDAGLVLSPGGLLIFCLLPITGRVVSRCDPRWLISAGFLLVSAATLVTARSINMEMDFGSAVRLRMLQCAGFAFLFVPIQMLAYATLPGGKNNQAASIMNLSRNLGASVGLAFLVTLIFRNRQVHHDHLVAHATPYDAHFGAKMDSLARVFEGSGVLPAEAVRRSGALLYHEMAKQHMELAYVDAFMSLGLLAGGAALLAWLSAWRTRVARLGPGLNS